MLKTINEYVDDEKEFSYIEQVCNYYTVPFSELCDFSLDNYTHLLRQNTEKRAAKIGSLNRATDYAMQYKKR